MVFIQNVLWYLILIGVMIMIHELGHYWAAVFFDVRVETFSFGFGPRLFGFKRGETDFRFSASSTATGGLLVFSFAGTLFPSPEISFPALLRLYRNQSLNAPA